MELRQLKYFMELANTLNFSRAAERLYISQPTLSQQIALLEEELSVKLFARTRRKVELTRAGQVYVDYCARMFALMDEASDKMRQMSRESTQERTFVIGVDESAPQLDKQGFFAAEEVLRTRFPDCKSYLKILPYKAIFPALQSGEIDVCLSIVMSDELERLPCKSKVFSRQGIVLFVPKTFALAHTDEDCIRLAAEQLELCLLSTDQRWANNFKRMLQRMDLPFRPLYINNYHSICTYVESGRGAMLDAEFSISSERERFSTPVLFPREKAEVLDVLLWNEECAHPILPEFIELMSTR